MSTIHMCRHCGLAFNTHQAAEQHPCFGRWLAQGVQLLKERGEWNETRATCADTQTQGEPHSVDPADRDSAGHGDQVA